MAGLFGRVKGLMGEAEDARALFDTPLPDRPIVVYAEDDYSWNQLEGYVRSLIEDYGRPIVYITSRPDDPLLEDHHPAMAVYMIRESIAKILPRIDSPVFVATMPDLDTFHVKRPKDSRCVYVFHSLNSTHMTYREGAFDAYDVFCCVGPYHRRELTARFAAVGKTGYDLRDVGYYKLDRVAAGFAGYEKAHPGETTILVAPSWGPDNLLATCGEPLIASLAAEGYRTVVRPHPAFFESVYAKGEPLVRSLQERFANISNVVFEMSITSENAFYEADVLISDWSGASFEYALGTERPVLFVDVPRKAFNKGWADLGIEPFEDRMRREVGTVLSPDSAGGAGAATAALLSAGDGYRDRIVAARDREVYNFGGAAAAGAAVIDELAG